MSSLDLGGQPPPPLHLPPPEIRLRVEKTLRQSRMRTERVTQSVVSGLTSRPPRKQMLTGPPRQQQPTSTPRANGVNNAHPTPTISPAARKLPPSPAGG